MNRDKIWHLLSRKLTGEASEEELYELQQFCDQYPALSRQMETMQQIWNTEAEVDKDYLEATYHLHYQKMKALGIEPRHIDEVEQEQSDTLQRSFFTNNRRKFVAFGSLAIVLIVSLFLVLTKKETVAATATADVTVPKEIVTKNGTSTKFLLPDGSTVWLNAGSKLDYTKIGESGNREIYLTGEAFFDVVKNPKRPFIIHTSSIDVKVLGTKFNVKAYPEDKTVETSLVQGSVEVFVRNRPGEKYLLKPNQKLVLLNTVDAAADELATQDVRPNLNLPIIAIKRLTYTETDTIAIETSWTQNKLVFKNEAFIDVAQKMERWYDVEIIFRNRKLEEELLNGDFRKETLIQALEGLRFTTDFNYRIEEKTVIIF
jgi:ferric-dicitrate binding protein FerR (iron transport regulator)